MSDGILPAAPVGAGAPSGTPLADPPFTPAQEVRIREIIAEARRRDLVQIVIDGLGNITGLEADDVPRPRDVRRCSTSDLLGSTAVDGSAYVIQVSAAGPQP